MVFSSLLFIFAFLSVTLLLYFALPKKFRMLVLFVMSLIFYGWGEPLYIIIMAVSIVSAYLFGFLIAKYRETNVKKAKLFLTLSLCVNLAFLAFFKYANFFINNISLIPIFSGLEPLEWLKLPVGISFYTFQIMSYSIDVFRGDANVQKKLIPFGTYVTLFPQLVAGPIVRYKDVDDQLRQRDENIEKFASGVKRFTAGLGKKILLADTVGAIATQMNDSMAFGFTTLGSWMLVIAYTFQIYFDFSGYSDMAIGLGRMFGFEFMENFDYPYISKSITEFWRRWHISLSTWFKEYVYIPLGGNRRGKLIQFRNIAVVWLLTGFWHGANWNYILWGVYFGVLLIIEKVFLLKKLEKAPAVVSRIYSLFFICIGWLIFYFTDFSVGFDCFKSLFGIGVTSFATKTDLYDLLRFLPLFVICGIASTPLPHKLFKKAEKNVVPFAYAVPVFTGIVLFASLVYLVASTFSPFLYFIF